LNASNRNSLPQDGSRGEILSFQAQAEAAARNAHSTITDQDHSHRQRHGRRAPWRELAEVSGAGAEGFKIFAVGDPDELTQASTLLQRRYAWRGYSVQPFEDRRRRITLSALHEDSTVATLTAALDCADGLYVEEVYPECVRTLRSRNRRLCEFTKFAVDESVRSQALLGAIFHVACMYALDVHRCTDALIEVNPRHVRFYERMLGFTQAAEQRLDPSVNAPAVLMRLDLRHSEREIDRLAGGYAAEPKNRSFYPYFFGRETAKIVLGRLRSH
jgi:hypothetical protein